MDNAAIFKLLNKTYSFPRLIEMSREMNYPVVSPAIASINITSRCNSRCCYCDIWESAEGFSEPTIEELCKLKESFVKLGIKKVSLSGGEPLLRKDLEEVISVFSKDMSVSVITNGILLTKERADSLVQAGVNIIVLSLDTLNPDIYKELRGVPFKHAQAALDVLMYVNEKYSGVFTSISCVVTSYNMKELVNFAKDVTKMGKNKIAITFQAYERVEGKQNDPLIPGNEDYTALKKEMNQLAGMKKLGCPINNSPEYLKFIPDYLVYRKMGDGFICDACYSSVSIDSNLELHPCYPLPSVANLRDEKLEDLWFSEKMNLQRIKMKNGECPGCSTVFHKETELGIDI
jgi:MoaA/NifB/PqqE/SkfB family radical SAM enzyme